MALTLVSGDTTSFYSASSTAFGYRDTVDPATFDLNPYAVVSAYIFDDEYITDTTELKALNNAAIPEPATATLSLLALAGLAASRRRK